jgi:hypothetical protein
LAYLGQVMSPAKRDIMPCEKAFQSLFSGLLAVERGIAE